MHYALFPLVRLLQAGAVELDHLEHRLRHTPGAGAVRIFHHLAEDLGRDLPAQAIAVFEPAALLDLAALRERVPQAVDLGLVLAFDHEGDRVIEWIEWPGAE